ncbi:hypothetical protein Vqi01_42310 [Micromonospora qiuiae]|uniref:SMODS-associating 2TM beta-strand rich effector domain-containing protein n=2 Tax=Micromonospora qiuiae TaxID=502268 RepID=A0ABQ4JHW2_9ACTN|nr:hypothetical protein Vqi01_42310 [Micromonospora qiuiae]
MGLWSLLDSAPARLAGRGSDLLQLAVLSVTALVALHGVAATWLISNHVAATALVAVPAAVVAVTVACYIRYVHMPADFVIEELNGLLIVTRVKGESGRDYHRYTYSRRQRVRAARHNLRLIGIRSHWSGQSRTVKQVTSLFPEHRLLDPALPEEDGRVHRWLYLHGPIARGRQLDVGIIHVFEDVYAPMKPYYRESGEERPVRRLSVRVRFDLDNAPVEAWQVVWKRSRAGTTRQEVARVECRPINDPNTGSVIYELLKSRPDPGCAYGICWRWPAGGSREETAGTLMAVGQQSTKI